MVAVLNPPARRQCSLRLADDTCTHNGCMATCWCLASKPHASWCNNPSDSRCTIAAAHSCREMRMWCMCRVQAVSAGKHQLAASVTTISAVHVSAVDLSIHSTNARSSPRQPMAAAGGPLVLKQAPCAPPHATHSNSKCMTNTYVHRQDTNRLAVLAQAPPLYSHHYSGHASWPAPTGWQMQLQANP